MGNNRSHFDWENIADQVQDVLGEQFWKEIQTVIPKRGPAIDIFETDSEGIVLVELPGLESIKHIHLSLRGSQLVIKGSLPYLYPIEKDDLILHERFLGNFKRTISLPFHFSVQNVKAHFKNGLLIIRIPKETQEQSIQVTEDFIGDVNIPHK